MAKRRGEIPEEAERTGAIPAPRHLDDITDRSVTQEPSANTEALYRVLAENATDVVLLTDATAHITWVSPSAGQEWGVDPGELIGLPSNTDIHPDDLAEVESVIRRADAGERGIYHEIRRRGNDHRPYRWLGVTASATLDDEGRVVGHIVSARDIHEQVVARQALADSERRYRLLAEHASDVVCRISDDGRLEWVPDSVLAVLGWQPAEILGRQFRDLVRPSRNPDDTDRTAAREERQVLRADGTFLWMVILRRVVTDEATFEVAALRDVQQEHDTRARWERLIQHDRLTGLAALPLGLTRLERLLGQSSARHRAGAVAVLCVSIDSLKSLNDAVTFAAGDLLLVEMANPNPFGAARSGPDHAWVGR
ncbi:MAG: PAS domain S-box protein [Candidatus Nanopelagicales bacterium]